MRYICDKKYIDFDCLEAEIDELEALTATIFQHYFNHSDEFANENPLLLAVDYWRFARLSSTCIDLVRNLKGTLSVVRENFEGGVPR